MTVTEPEMQKIAVALVKAEIADVKAELLTSCLVGLLGLQTFAIVGAMVLLAH